MCVSDCGVQCRQCAFKADGCWSIGLFALLMEGAVTSRV